MMGQRYEMTPGRQAGVRSHGECAKIQGDVCHSLRELICQRFRGEAVKLFAGGRGSNMKGLKTRGRSVDFIRTAMGNY